MKLTYAKPTILRMGSMAAVTKSGSLGRYLDSGLPLKGWRITKPKS